MSQPITIELKETPNYEGKQVIVEGVVTEHRLTTYGGQIIQIKDFDEENSTELTVFVERQTPVEYGDKIQATGIVQKYEGEWELVVDNERFIKILQKWNNTSFPLWQIAENPNKYIGLNINVYGIIERDYGSYFYLIDSDGEYTIAVYYDSSQFHNFSEGDMVRVGARFVYDSPTVRYLLRVEDETHNITLLERRS